MLFKTHLNKYLLFFWSFFYFTKTYNVCKEQLSEQHWFKDTADATINTVQPKIPSHVICVHTTMTGTRTKKLQDSKVLQVLKDIR